MAKKKKGKPQTKKTTYIKKADVKLKKETQKEKYARAISAGIESKQARNMRGWSSARIDKEIKRVQRNAERRQAYKQARAEGMKPEDARKARSRKQKFNGDKLLVLGYEAFHEGADTQKLFEYKEFYLTQTNDYLIMTCIGDLEFKDNFGDVGDSRAYTFNDKDAAIDFLDDLKQIPAFIGSGANLHNLLASIASLLMMMYTVVLRDIFLQEVFTKMRGLSSPTARKNAETIRYIWEEGNKRK